MNVAVLAAVFLAIGALAGFALGRRSRRTHSTAPVDVAVDAQLHAYLQSLAEFGNRVTPVWSAHVQTSRQQMETAVTGLVGKFGGIVSLLDVALNSSQDAMRDNVDDIFDTSRTRLGEVVTSLDSAVEEKRRTMDSMRAVAALSNEMKVMTTQVSRIAAQTRLLALNAAIEAARVGEVGKGFSVVAAEVRELADLSGATGERIEEMVDRATSAIANALTAAEVDAAVESAMVNDANEKVHSVLDSLLSFVSGLHDASADLGHTASEIKDEIAQSLVHFQFQDRIAQQLSHLTTGIDSFSDALRRAESDDAHQLEPIDSTTMLAELGDTYTMREEHQLHEAGTAVAAPQPESEIVFF